jgi:uncharacterized alpha/beta hydrolase family protein
MKEFIDNSLDKLRKKDDPQKVVISFIAAAIITFVIVSSWLTWNLVNDDKETSQTQDTKKASQEVTPISNIGSQASEIKGMFGELVEQFKSTQEVLEAIPEIVEEQQNSTTTMEIESSSE